MRCLLAIAILSCLCSGANAAPDTYKWIDEANATHYSDTLPFAQKPIKVKLWQNVIETSIEPYEVTQAAKKNPISLFTFPECGSPCEQAQAVLDGRGLPYTIRNKNQDKLILQKMTGRLEIPVILIGNRPPMVGFDGHRLNKTLDEAGYPRSNPFAGLKKPAKAVLASVDKLPSPVPAANAKTQAVKPGSK